MTPSDFKAWTSWVVATMAAGLTMATYAFSTFETKENAKDKESKIEKQLDIIRNNQDKTLELLIKIKQK